MSSSFSRFFVVLLLGGWISVWAQDAPLSAAPADERADNSSPAGSQEQATIAEERQQLLAREAELTGQLQALQSRSVDQPMVDEAQADVDTARLRQDDLQAEISSAERRIGKFKEQIKALEAREQLLQNPARQDELSSEARSEQLRLTRQTLADQRMGLEQEVMHLQNLRQKLELAAQRLALLQQWLAGVADEYNRQLALGLEEDRKSAQTRLQQRLQEYRAQADSLARRLKEQGDSLSDFHRLRLKSELLVAEEQVKLAQLISICSKSKIRSGNWRSWRKTRWCPLKNCETGRNNSATCAANWKNIV
ncbi:MAG: hypothetical protein R3F37_18640 [Candidatus Competibacteraceae bacterium]